MYNHFVQSIKTSYHWDFLKVVVSKCSMKGATYSSFHRAPCAWLNIGRESEKMHWLGKLFQVLIKFFRKTFPFPKVAVFKCSMEGAVSSSLGRAPCT